MHLDTDRLLVGDLEESDLDWVHEILDLDLWQPGRSRAERARWLTSHRQLPDLGGAPTQ
jgi:hypothetical protein